VSSQDRKNARYARQLDVDVAGLEIITSNVAAGGVQLCCPEMRYSGFKTAARDDGALNFKIRLPGTQKWLAVEGRVRYADLCDDEYLIGFQFTAWRDQDAADWSRYIETLSSAKPID
jgi:hypothetical protein